MAGLLGETPSLVKRGSVEHRRRAEVAGRFRDARRLPRSAIAVGWNYRIDGQLVCRAHVSGLMVWLLSKHPRLALYEVRPSGHGQQRRTQGQGR
jgi:hypothetical protein